ncbi:YncE family protein [Streptomyces bambusae]|uniref:beta-propeller fold lactonase family protein n=1 Tax=Streptomyces bambusae TaxID=1550616 RepID=UPI001CFE0761|nr:YncE family protein [Streptomyces bambusae]MCB5167418.1 YncE family protein [Streptomyces bambusae]
MAMTSAKTRAAAATLTPKAARRAGGFARRARLGAVPFAALAVVLATSPGSATSAQGRHGTFAFVTQQDNVAVVKVVDKGRELDLESRIHLEKDSFAIGVAISPDGKRAYVADNTEGVVEVFDTRNDERLATIELGTTPVGIAITRDGRRAYTANSTNNSVSVIDLQTNTRVGADIPVGSSPRGVSVSADGKRVYTANDRSGTVSVIDTETRTVTTIADVGAAPRVVALWDAKHLGFVTNSRNDFLTVIDTKDNKILKRIEGVERPVGAVFSTKRQLLYVADTGDDTVSVVNVRRAIPTINKIDLGCSPLWVSLSPDQKRLFVTCVGDGKLTMIDTEDNEVLDSYEVGSPASQSAVVTLP